MSSSSLQIGLATVPVLEDIAREGARRYLQKAIEEEVAAYVDAHRDVLDASGHRLVVRNGHKPPRTILTGLGPLEVTQPRVDDRRIDENGERFRFTSKILPPYLRKTKTIEELVPWLYLKGISTNDMSDALIHLGFDGSGLSPASVVRMKELWIAEHHNWSKRDLIGKRYVYLWADGLYFGVRLTDERPCVLVIMGATEDGTDRHPRRRKREYGTPTAEDLDPSNGCSPQPWNTYRGVSVPKCSKMFHFAVSCFTLVAH